MENRRVLWYDVVKWVSVCHITPERGQPHDIFYPHPAPGIGGRGRRPGPGRVRRPAAGGCPGAGDPLRGRRHLLRPGDGAAGHAAGYLPGGTPGPGGVPLLPGDTRLPGSSFLRRDLCLLLGGFLFGAPFLQRAPLLQFQQHPAAPVLPGAGGRGPGGRGAGKGRTGGGRRGGTGPAPQPPQRRFRLRGRFQLHADAQAGPKARPKARPGARA